MKKQKIIIIILIIVIVLLVGYIFFGDYLFNFNNGKETSSSISANGSQADDGSQQGVIPDTSSGVVIVEDNKDLFENPDSYAGKTVEISGTVSDEPTNNQGILAFTLITDAQDYAYINYLDMEEAVTVKKGDLVKIIGVVSNGIQTEDPNGLTIVIPMIIANQLDIG